MDIHVAALCDSAMDYQGKLCLLGAFDTIFAQRLPAVHPYCSVAFRVVFGKGDGGTHKFRINFVDEDGRNVLPTFEAAVEVGVPPDVFFVSRNVILNIQHLEFKKEGLYSVDLTADGRVLASIPLHVKAMPAPPEEEDEKS